MNVVPASAEVTLHLAAMRTDEVFHDEEPQADAPLLAAHRHAARHRLEERREDLGRNRRALVVNPQRHRIFGLPVYLQPHSRRWRAVGDRVGEQVVEHLAQAARVPLAVPRP